MLTIVDVDELELNWLRRAARDFHKAEACSLTALLGALTEPLFMQRAQLFFVQIADLVQFLPQPRDVSTCDEIAGMHYIIITLAPNCEDAIAHFAARELFGRVAYHVLNLLDKNSEHAALGLRVRIFEG